MIREHKLRPLCEVKVEEGSFAKNFQKTRKFTKLFLLKQRNAKLFDICFTDFALNLQNGRGLLFWE